MTRGRGWVCHHQCQWQGASSSGRLTSTKIKQILSIPSCFFKEGGKKLSSGELNWKIMWKIYFPQYMYRQEGSILKQY